MKISAIVLSGIAGAKISSSGAKAVILRGGLAIAFKPAALPPWYDIIVVTDAIAFVVTIPLGDSVTVTDAVAASVISELSDSVTVSDSVSTVSNLSSTQSDSVTVSDTCLAQIINRRRFVAGDYIGNHSLG